MPRLIRPLPGDLGLAALLAAWWMSDVDAPDPLTAAALVLVTLPLGWRRTAPLAATLVVATGLVVGALPPAPPEPLAQLVAVLVAPWSTALHAATTRRAVVGGACVVAAGALSAMLVGDGDVAFIVLLLGAAWAAGFGLRRVHARSEALATRAGALAERAERAAEDERRRIARELHDVVSHGVSLMVVQSTAARQLVRTDPAGAERALGAVETAGRAAVDDLRRMLGLLRGPDAEDARLPQPGLAALDALVVADGERVALERGPLPALPAALDLAAFRIVQEGLTNARKHAPGRPTSVRVGCSGGRLELEVRTAGVAARPGPDGHGLLGLRERVAIYGGRLDAGPDAGDWVLRAMLPVPAA